MSYISLQSICRLNKTESYNYINVKLLSKNKDIISLRLVIKRKPRTEILSREKLKKINRLGRSLCFISTVQME